MRRAGYDHAVVQVPVFTVPVCIWIEYGGQPPCGLPLRELRKTICSLLPASLMRGCSLSTSPSMVLFVTATSRAPSGARAVHAVMDHPRHAARVLVLVVGEVSRPPSR